MDKFIIQGGSQLSGSIAVKGAKNHALKVFAASLLSVEPITITNVPHIEDIMRLQDILIEIGADIKHEGVGSYQIDTSKVNTTLLPEELVPKLRASIVLLGPMLARFRKVSMPHPGGCDIGRRPIDLFIAGLESMGATHVDDNGMHHFEAPHGLQGTRFVFSKVSVTATETLMMAAVLATGTTTLVNVAREPEVVALAEYLNAQGAQISGIGTGELVIEGVERIRGGECAIIPDRIEVLSFLYLAMAARQKLTITYCDPSTVEMPLQLLRDSGARIEQTESSITVFPWETLKPINVTTLEYPGFPTDGQPPFVVLLSQIEGESSVQETIQTNRLFFTDMLNRMGSNIVMHTPQHITIYGGTVLRAKEVESPDLRAGIAMVIAGVIAEGETTIDNVYQIDRGYEAIDERLRSIGVDIRRIT